MLIKKYVEEFDIEGSIDKTIDELRKLKEKYEGLGWTDLEVEKDYGYDYNVYRLYGMKEENESEKLTRLRREEVTEREERHQYETLKRKFG